MKFERNEVRTGLLLVITIGILVSVMLLLGAPGLFHPLKTYGIFFDNAEGVRQGASVLLAGRKIGEVIKITSPVHRALRPTQHPDYEVFIEVRVDKDANVYRNATPRMTQVGLLGEQVIDFVSGDEAAGLATSGYTFIGTRTPDFSESISRMIQILEPVTSNATLTLDDLRKTIASMNVFFAQQGELAEALAGIKQVAQNVAHITAKDGPLAGTFQNIEKLTASLDDKNGSLQVALANLRDTTEQLNHDDNVKKMLAHFEEASVHANEAILRLNGVISSLKPQLTTVVTNVGQMTDTLKKQPWRLIFPVTKTYPPQTSPVVMVVNHDRGAQTTRREHRRRTSAIDSNDLDLSPVPSAR